MSNLKKKTNGRQFKSAKWNEWANRLWKSKKNNLLSSGALKTDIWNIIGNIKIIINCNPKFTKLKKIWIQDAESKLAELEIKTQVREKDEKMEFLQNLQIRLEEKLDDLINNWLEERNL